MSMPKLPIKSDTLRTQALTHRSYLNENKSTKVHNERLEFLGDAVLELAISEFLYHKYPDQPEGLLTAYRSSLVKTDTLASVAGQIGLGEILFMSKGEELSGGRTNKSLLANTFEAVVGAIYLDQGFEEVVKFLKLHLTPQIDTIISQGLFKDNKSLLQEKVQAQGHDSPIYKVVKEIGPDHSKNFTVSVSVDNTQVATGVGKSKQLAQQNAATNALEKLGLD